MKRFACADQNENMLGPLAKDFPIMWTAGRYRKMVASTDGREKMIDAISCGWRTSRSKRVELSVARFDCVGKPHDRV
jgi:hypothetical protein